MERTERTENEEEYRIKEDPESGRVKIVTMDMLSQDLWELLGARPSEKKSVSPSDEFRSIHTMAYIKGLLFAMEKIASKMDILMLYPDRYLSSEDGERLEYLRAKIPKYIFEMKTLMGKYTDAMCEEIDLWKKEEEKEDEGRDDQ